MYRKVNQLYIFIYIYIHSFFLFRFFSHTDHCRVLSTIPYASQDCLALLVKNLPASAGDTKDPGLIPRSGRSPGVGNGNPLRYSWEIPWTEEPGGLQSMGSQRNMTESRVHNVLYLCPYPSSILYIVMCMCQSQEIYVWCILTWILFPSHCWEHEGAFL